MAKNKGRRGPLKVVRTQNAMALATLGSEVVIKSDHNSVDNKQFLLSVTGTYSLRDHTPAEGPIMIGWAHGDYTVAEIAESIQITGDWDSGNQIAQERSHRKIRIVGTFSGLETDETLNDGKAIKTSLKFNIENLQFISLWAMNRSGAALTTGSDIVFDGKFFMKPQ